MTGSLRTYAAFARLGFLEILQYRLRYVTGILTYLVYVSAYAFLWRGIYGGAERVRGFDVAAMTHFIALGWIFRSFYFNNIDREVADEVREGKIGTQLLKPVVYPAAKLVTALGEWASGWSSSRVRSRWSWDGCSRSRRPRGSGPRRGRRPACCWPSW